MYEVIYLSLIHTVIQHHPCTYLLEYLLKTHPKYSEANKNPFEASQLENVVIKVVVNVASNVTKLTVDTDESYALSIEPDSQQVTTPKCGLCQCDQNWQNFATVANLHSLWSQLWVVYLAFVNKLSYFDQILFIVNAQILNRKILSSGLFTASHNNSLLISFKAVMALYTRFNYFQFEWNSMCDIRMFSISKYGTITQTQR